MEADRMILSYHDNYSSQSIYDTIRKFIESDDSLRRKFVPGAELLIKPNLCLPQPTEKAITTNPILIEHVIKIALDMKIKVSIGESSIPLPMENAFEHLIRVTGIYDLGKKYNIEVFDLNEYGFINTSFEINGRKILAPISKRFMEAEIVVNMPKFKTHILTGFTGAIKNMYGCVRGKFKGLIHGYAESQSNFCYILTEIYRQKKIDLTIMDAIEGLDGDGPGVLGKAKKFGFMLVGNDGYMIDKYCVSMMGVDPDVILTNYFYKKLENVTQDDPLFNHEIPKLNIQLPYTFNNLNQLKSDFKIIINTEKCTQCGSCAGQCPKKCITTENGNMKITGDKCIHCLCCHEVCPEGAVDIVI
jgi:uncharacterized protein (DUF362 family)/NAD-dependent dihydropyrimidine dehydrogenase PreA subunit